MAGSEFAEPCFEAPRFARLRETLAGVDLSAARYLDRGWQVTAYRAGYWIIRVPLSPESHSSIERQTRLYQELARSGLQVPRDAQVVYGEAGEVVAGIYRDIPGEHAAPGRWNARLIRDIGLFLTVLHGVPTERVTDCCEVVEDLWSGRFGPRWERCRPCLSPDEREWVEGSIQGFFEGGGAEGASLAPVHGDLGEEHVIIEGDGSLSGVIDFSGPRIADPALDFGALADRFGQALAEAVLAEYGGAVDHGFARRARFYADVRPLSTIALGLMRDCEERVRRGRRRLAARMSAGG